MNLIEMVSEIEAAGASLRLKGDKVCVWYPTLERREELASQVALLRNRRAEVAAFLKARDVIPKMPTGVFLVNWELKNPPVALETCGIVTDPALFVRTTLAQLEVALTYPKRWVGWSIPQLIDRLAQAGVAVEVESGSTFSRSL